MTKSPHTPEWRAMVAKQYLDGNASSPDIAKRFGINDRTVRRWAQRYQEQGIAAFECASGNASYTTEFKMNCVELYIPVKCLEILRFYSEEHPQDRYHCKTPIEVRQEALVSDV